MTFTCQRCGQCCTEVAKPDAWIKYGSDFTIKEKLQLLNFRASYPFGKRQALCCEMYVVRIKDGVNICIIEQLLGKHRKPDMCNNYPKSGDCYRMQKERLDKGIDMEESARKGE